MSKFLIIPDCQVRPGDDLNYLKCIGKFIVDKRPDVIVNLGDFADLPSLSSYDVGKKVFEGRRYKADIQAAHAGMEALLTPIWDYNKKAKHGHRERYTPRMILTLGNHCNRINRAVNDDPKLDGTIGIEDLRYREYGWEVYDFLDVVVVGGIAFSHYFVTGVAGRPAGTDKSIG